jgi:putative inorganic carbon (hco3(-)) transporter
MFTQLLTIFSFEPADPFWQQTIASSKVIGAFRALGRILSFGIKAKALGALLQLLSFGTVILLFAAIALPQFANDKEGLALFPIVSLALWFAGKILGGQETRRPIAADIFVILYICINIIAAAASHYFYPSLRGLAKVVVYALSYFILTAQFSNNVRRRLLLVSVLVAVGTLVAAYGLYQYKTGVAPLATWEDPTLESKAVRIYSTLNNPNLLAGYLVPLVPLSISLTVAAMVRGFWLVSAIPFASSLILILATLLTGSRGGYLALIVEIVALAVIAGGYLWQRKPKSRALLLTAAIALPLVGFGCLHFLPSFEQRFSSIFVGREHSSNSFRMNVWLSSLAMLKDNWWLGIGVGNQAFVLAYGLYMHTGYDALGTYCVPLEVAVETGLAGLLIFALMIVAGLCRGHLGFWAQQPEWQRWLTAGAAAAMIGLMTHGMVDTVFYRPQVQFIFWLVLSLLVSSPPQMANEKK